MITRRFQFIAEANQPEGPSRPEPVDPRAEENAALDAFSRVVVRVADALMPAVVNIRAGQGNRGGSGSGVLFTPDGFLLTNHHVVQDQTQVRVRLRDGRRAVVSTDGGQRPRWTSAGLFFESRGQIVRTSIDGSAADLRVAPLVRAAGLNGATLRGVSPDGRFLVEWPGEPPTSATVSLDWIREVRALIGPPAATLPR